MSAAAHIRGLGTALPRGEIDAATTGRLLPELLGLDARESRAFASLVQRSGVERRRSVLVGEDGQLSLYARGAAEPGTAQRMAAWRELAPPLAIEAARGALLEAGWRGEDVTDLVLVSCTGFAAPGVDLALIEALGLPSTLERTHVGFMGCHGAVNGLRVARGLLAAKPHARVLLVAVELCTLHLTRSERTGQTVASALFSDGSAALAIDAEGPGLRIAATGSMLVPHTADLMGWDVGDRGFGMTLSPNVPGAIEAHLRPWIDSWLESSGLSLADVGGFAVHPGGTRVLDSVERCLELPPHALSPSRALLRDLGNLSSPTVLFLTRELLAQNAPRPYLLLAFGPGLFAEAALLR